jgi:hypothetical protein
MNRAVRKARLTRRIAVPLTRRRSTGYRASTMQVCMILSRKVLTRCADRSATLNRSAAGDIRASQCQPHLEVRSIARWLEKRDFLSGFQQVPTGSADKGDHPGLHPTGRSQWPCVDLGSRGVRRSTDAARSSHLGVHFWAAACPRR